MPRIKVNGKGSVSKRELAIILEFFVDKLVGKRLSKNLTIHLQLKRNLLKKENVFGDCFYVDSNERPREFKIRLDNRMKRQELLQTLAHECVHVKQYARGELKDMLIKPVTKWRGDYVSDETPYDELPWEIEADQRERELLEAYNEWSSSR